VRADEWFPGRILSRLSAIFLPQFCCALRRTCCVRRSAFWRAAYWRLYVPSAATQHHAAPAPLRYGVFCRARRRASVNGRRCRTFALRPFAALRRHFLPAAFNFTACAHLQRTRTADLPGCACCGDAPGVHACTRGRRRAASTMPLCSFSYGCMCSSRSGSLPSGGQSPLTCLEILWKATLEEEALLAATTGDRLPGYMPTHHYRLPFTVHAWHCWRAPVAHTTFCVEPVMLYVTVLPYLCGDILVR